MRTDSDETTWRNETVRMIQNLLTRIKIDLL